MASRPSSRVLAPPGGGSSDIFGTPANYTPPQPATLSAQRAAANMSSSVFGGGGGGGVQQQQYVQPQQQQQQQYVQPQQQQKMAAGGSGSQANMGGYGSYDITGKPTSRVLAPPGGGSSISFGAPPPQQQVCLWLGALIMNALLNSLAHLFVSGIGPTNRSGRSTSCCQCSV